MQWDKIDRRRHLRIEFPYTIHIIFSDERAISTYTEDISRGGVKVVLKEELAVNSEVKLKIFISQAQVECKGKVIWACKRDDSPLGEIFDTGIE